MVSDPVAPVEGVGGVEAGYHSLYALRAIDGQGVGRPATQDPRLTSGSPAM